MIRLRLVIATALAAAVLPAAAGEVVVYSSNSVDALNTVATEFNKKYPDIKMTYVRGSTGAMMQRIKAEAGAPKADLFWSGGFSMLGLYKDYFAPYAAGDAAAVRPAFRGPNDAWLGTNAHVMVIMVNKKGLRGDAAPRSWAEVADPKWKDRLVIGDPEKTSSSYAILWGIHETLGKDVLKGIARNGTMVNTASAVYEGVAKGEFAVGLTMEYAAQEYVAGGQKDIEVIYPKEGTFIAPEGMVLVKGAPHAEDAKKLFDFLASKGAQEALLKAYFRRPVREDIDTRGIAGLPAINTIKVSPIDDAKATAGQPEFIKAWRDLVANAK